jgi:pimeloyl-ACP methyl ester carboxylesterase
MTRALPCEVVAFGLRAGGHRLWAQAILPAGRQLAGPAPVMVFLHEGLGSITQWRDFPLALVQATGLPALIYDRHGHGRSEPLREARGPGFLEWEAQVCLPEVLAACGIEAPVLIGHSDGGSIALIFGASFPRVPLGIVAMAAHVFVEDLTIQSIWKALRAFETTPLRPQLARHHGPKVDAMFHAWAGVWLSAAFRDWTMVDRLAGIEVPVLALQGEDDEYGTPAQLQAIHDHVDAYVEAHLLPQCAHAPHLQAREATLRAITRFLLDPLIE